MDIAYQLEPDLSVEAFIDVLQRSTLAERRPVNRPDLMKGMLRHADIILTARIEGELVGISRAISDFSFCTYLSDLAVDVKVQKRGIGKALVLRTHEIAGLHTMLLLLAAPAAVNYYPKIGMQQHGSAWCFARRNE